MSNFAAIVTAMNNAQATTFAKSRPYVMRKGFNAFLSNNSLSYSLEAGVLWACIIAIHNMDATMYYDSSLPNETEHVRYQPPTPAGGAAPQATTWDGQNAVPAGTFADEVNPEEFAACVASIPNAIRWVMDLTACFQVKELNPGNVANYFAGVPKLRVTGRLLVPLFSYTASRFAQIMTDQNARATLTQNVFITYHTSYASTPKLCEEMLNASTAITSAILSAAQRNAIANAVTNIHDAAACNAIDTKTIACCHAYLAAFGKLPDNWYQGDKAKSAYPATLYAQMRQIWTRYKELTTGGTAVQNATDETTLVNAIPAGIHC